MHGVIEYDMSNVRGPLASTFVVLINALFFNIKLIGIDDEYPKDISDTLLKEYESEFDFIIVGAGSAGCSLANILTENPKWHVLLLEAGDYPTPLTEVPNLFPNLQGTSEDWNFPIENEERACLSTKCSINRGKVLGGTSSIGDLIYMRGLADDYDSQIFESWGSNVSFTVFEKLESYNKSGIIFNVEYGEDGPIKLEYNNYTGTPKNFLKHAYKAMGLSNMPPLHFLGYSDFLVTKLNGERRNMAKNFLGPIKDRYNLYFSKNSEVFHVHLDNDAEATALGVNVSIKGHRMFVKAKYEVILTAGAINNAKLLLLSGVGDRNYLYQRNIPFYVDLPGVGRNLQMHLTLPLFVTYQPESKCARDFYTDTDIIKETYDYIIHRSGDLSHTNINEFVAFITTTKTGITLPNLAVRHKYFRIDDRRLRNWVEAMGYHPRIITNLLRKNREAAIVLFDLVLIHPVSTGEVLLNDTYHLGSPKINAKFLSDPDNIDYETLLSGFDFVTFMIEKLEGQAHFLDLDIPNCRNYKFCTLGYVKCYIHNMATPNADVAGTVAMGNEGEESLAVVKETLEVRFTKHLRVADSSVLNKITIANTIATDAMIGFKMAEILKEKWYTEYRSEYIPKARTRDRDES